MSEPSTVPPPATRTVAAAGAIVLTVLVTAIPAFWFTPLNHDVACGLIYARRMMAGDVLYRDIIDNNPPLAFYFAMPIEWFAQHTGLLESQALAITVAAFTIVTIWLCARLLRLDRALRPAVRWTFLFICAVVSMLLPAHDFGQREHFSFLLVAPYCVLCGLRAEGRIGHTALRLPSSILVGTLAAFGFALKPHFALVWLALVCYVALRRGWRATLNAENAALFAWMCLYAGFILLVTPAYVTTMVPMAARHYGAYTVGISVLLADPDVRRLLLALLLLACFASFISGARETAGLARSMALTGLAFFAIFIGEQTPFRYHLLPALVFYVLALVTAAAGFVHTLAIGTAPSRVPHRSLARLVLRTFALGLALMCVESLIQPTFETHRQDLANERAGIHSPLVGRLDEIVRAAAAGQPIYVLSSSVNPAFPLVNLSDTRWPYHYNTLWLLPTYYRNDPHGDGARYHSPDTQPPGERAFFDAIVSDLRQTPPAVLIVDRSPFKQGFAAIQFDFLDYFSQSPEFAALFREYALIGSVGPYAVYKRGASRDGA